MGMNQSETNFYRWLIDEKNYDPNEIEFRGSGTPDFNSKDEEWEVKKLYSDKIMLYSEHQVDYIENGEKDSYLSVMPENPGSEIKPLFVIPCSKLSVNDEPLFKNLDEWCIREEVPQMLKYKSFRIKLKGVTTFRVTLKSKELFERMIERINKDGTFRSKSHLVESALSEYLIEESKHLEPI